MKDISADGLSGRLCNMWLPSKNDCLVSFRTLSVVLLCGIVGILPDIDHIAAYFQGIPNGEDVRIWHPYIFIGVCIAIFCLSAYCAGLYIRTILRKKDVTK